PLVSAKRNGGVVRLSWSEADNGGSPITGYNILRSVTPGTETLIATTPPTQLRYDDPAANDPNLTYYYKVVALNSFGASCGNNEVAARFVGDSYSATGFLVANDPVAEVGPPAANPDLDIVSLHISEPGSGPNAGKLVFNLKMQNLSVIPPSRRWRIIWNSQSAPDGQYYLGMTSDNTGAISFEYGTVATPVIGLVLGDPQTTKVGDPDAASFTPDGLITFAISRDKIGNPQTGDLLGGISVRTYTDTTNKVRSTNAIDTTANASANDDTANAFTYALVGPQSARLQNISTRTQVGLGEKVLIGGFIISGNDAKKVVARGRGPSLIGVQNITDPLHDPIIELYNNIPGSPPIATNDNWQDTQKTEIDATGLAPANQFESAIVQTLAPGNYTIILRDKDTSAPRLGIVEVFDVSPAANGQLGNLSSRGFVGTGDNVLIGGVIVGPPGTGNDKILVRSLGPSLGSFGVGGTLTDPNIRLVGENGTPIAANDDWRANEAAIQSQAPTLAPPKDAEAALIASLAPGLYTVVVDGKGKTGVATVEIYSLGSP
ncbi:MAG TPA: fibronectin type III domain-containing protein, partial [Chthoniobacterales bacterium]|nr:fibronectin type III domain-containing protein [Chthoniobacterales bacterium]